VVPRGRAEVGRAAVKQVTNIWIVYGRREIAGHSSKI
jgi:hypothetical protein